MGFVVARKIRELNPPPTSFSISMALLFLTLIPNALILLERWVLGYDLVTRHVPLGPPVQEMATQFVLKLEEQAVGMNLDDYTGLMSIGAGFVMAWSIATLVSMVILRGATSRSRTSWVKMQSYE